MTLDPLHLPSVATLHAELVHEHDSILGESPLWDDREQVLYWVDIDRGQIHRFDPVTKTNSTFILGGKVTSIGRRASGGLIASFKKNFAAFDPATGSVGLLDEVETDQTEDRCAATGGEFISMHTRPARVGRTLFCSLKITKTKP